MTAMLGCLAFILTVQSVNSPISKNYAFSDYSVYQYEYTSNVRRLLVSIYLAWALVIYVSVMPGRTYQQYTLMYYPMILITVTFAFQGIDQLFKGGRYKKILGILTAALVVYNVLLPNMKEIVSNIRLYTKAETAKVEVVNFFNQILGDYEISVVSPDDNWVYLQTGHHSSTKYSYTQADLIYENIKTDFIKEYSSAINENHPRFIVESQRNKLYSHKIAANVQYSYEEVFRNDRYIIYERMVMVNQTGQL